MKTILHALLAVALVGCATKTPQRPREAFVPKPDPEPVRVSVTKSRESITKATDSNKATQTQVEVVERIVERIVKENDSPVVQELHNEVQKLRFRVSETDMALRSAQEALARSETEVVRLTERIAASEAEKESFVRDFNVAVTEKAETEKQLHFAQSSRDRWRKFALWTGGGCVVLIAAGLVLWKMRLL